MVATFLVVGLIAWVIKGAAEDVVRAWRGEPSTAPRGGFRGYVNDRWKALADHHHAVAASGMLTAGDARQARKHLARTKALKLAGFATDEDVARAKAEHQHRLGFIAKGIDPDTMPPLFPPRGGAWEPPVEADLILEPHNSPEPPPEPTVDDHFHSNANTWGTEFADAARAEQHDSQPGIDNYEPPGPLHWSPFESTDNTDTKENSTMSNNGEITGPASVLQFHNDLKAAMDASVTIVDTLTATAAELEDRAKDVDANITATETAAAGMGGLGMGDAADAARALMENQKAIQDSLSALADAIKQHSGAILDQINGTAFYLSMIKSAHDAQLAVQDARAGAGHGNLATDTFLDGND